jgi:hypothetical protein
MKKSNLLTLWVLVPLGVFAALIGCTNESPVPDSGTTFHGKRATDLSSSRKGIIHHVSAGGADTGPGINANYSLVANMMADGSVKGQFTDRFGHGNTGFHATIDCMAIVGNEAWLSGVITQGVDGNGNDYTGKTVLTKVVDNGQKGDLISFSYIDYSIPCSVKPNLTTFPANGQVKVW